MATQKQVDVERVAELVQRFGRLLRMIRDVDVASHREPFYPPHEPDARERTHSRIRRLIGRGSRLTKALIDTRFDLAAELGVDPDTLHEDPRLRARCERWKAREAARAAAAAGASDAT